MTDHWGDFDFDHPDFDHHDLPHDSPADPHDVDPGSHDPGPDDLGRHDPDVHGGAGAIEHPAFEHPAFEDQAFEDHAEARDVPAMSEAVADDLFPPALDVGELPEPVDGFPWIDTATLGAPDDTGFVSALDPVTPDELAAYAHTSGPADWAALADSDDPATSALARWWTPDEQ
ncbi:hypothetical protein AB0F72_19680 [Actinoplanes sp. NPDC023936]|uniref:hypothetical protein n=1 Tax=Actinoplanes sp. NPDC023936 TaxID=3154910 RepID=UPI0033FCE296